MRSRTNRINVWLSDEELADLNEKVSRVRGSRERFIRQCISGAAIREAPSVDVPKLIYEVRRVGGRKPYSVILFDEIEKAHPDIFNILLQILDDGRLTDSHGRTVSFKNTVIIMTSNIGASEIKKNTKLGFGASGESDYENIKEKQLSALKRTMKPEFINRIDDIIIFKSLEKKDIGEIADILIKSLAKRLKSQNINIKITERAKDFIVDKGFDSEYGARPLKRAIQKNIEDELSEQILMNKVAIGDTVIIDFDVNAGKLTYTPNK